MHSSPTNSPLTRSHDDKFLGGVAGGLGAYFGVDPVIFRVGFAVSILFSGAGLIAYLVLLAVLPADADDRTPVPA
jgi:phage shock protein PspC (stress-responsive transcriptional regulator)